MIGSTQVGSRACNVVQWSLLPISWRDTIQTEKDGDGELGEWSQDSGNSPQHIEGKPAS